MLGLMAGIVSASNEAAKSANFQSSLLGVVHTSSGTSRNGETRRIDVNDSGNIKTSKEELEVVRSTGTGTGGLYVAGNTTNTFVNTWVSSAPCRGLIENCNVIRLASQASKVYVDKIRIARQVGSSGELDVANGTTGTTSVKFYDSRGSTAAAFEVFSWGGSSNTWTPVEMWFSSGVTVRKISDADLFIYLGKQAR